MLVCLFVFKREKEYEVGWVERWGRISDELREGKGYDLNVLYEALKQEIKSLVPKCGLGFPHKNLVMSSKRL